jgi:hypothetical protein
MMSDREYRLFILRCLAVMVTVCSAGIHCFKATKSTGDDKKALLAGVAVTEKKAEELAEQFAANANVNGEGMWNEMAVQAEQDRIAKEEAAKKEPPKEDAKPDAAAPMPAMPMNMNSSMTMMMMMTDGGM